MATKINEQKLLISEMFYSVQCEGISTGMPSVFIRLAMCNLSCGFSPKFVRDFKKDPGTVEAGELVGDLHQSGGASWTCLLDSHRVKTPKGSLKLKDVKVGDELLGFNELTSEIEITNVVRAECVSVSSENLITITLENNKKLHCTKDHLFFVNEKWVRADELKINDEVWHIPYHLGQGLNTKYKWATYSEDKKSKISEKLKKVDKSYMYTDEYKLAHSKGQERIDWDKVSRRMKENNPMKNPETARKSWSKRHIHKISGPEKAVLNLEKQYNWGIKYCGNGTLWIENQNPDFIIDGTKKLIETYDSSYPQYNRDADWENRRKVIYEKHGYEVLFIDMFNKEKNNSNYTIEKKSSVVSQIQQFLMNGLKVLDISKYKGRNNVITKLECSPHKNYFAESVLSHNCDTMPVWIKGREWEFQEVIDWFKSEGIYEDILSGKIHIIWTGGEPTIPGHQESIFNFCNYWCDYNNGVLDTVFFEIETNGTIEFSKIAPWINQVNCSPKLKNSGMAKSQRYRPEVLSWINTHTNCQFKFVISSEEDIEEVFIDFISPIDVMLGNEPWAGIDFESVVCMPGLDSQEDFHERTRWVLEMAKKYKFRGMTRLHVSAWDKTTGV